MKAPKRSIADHLSFVTWIIFCIVITIMMIQIPKAANAGEFYDGQYELAEKYINGDTHVRGLVDGMILGVVSMHNLIHQAAQTGEECILTDKETDDLAKRVARDILAYKYGETASLRNVLVMATDATCGIQTGDSVTKALSAMSVDPKKRI